MRDDNFDNQDDLYDSKLMEVGEKSRKADSLNMNNIYILNDGNDIFQDKLLKILVTKKWWQQ